MKIPEKVRWWLSHPRLEFIYLLGGVPKEHGGAVIHYRNVENVIANLQKQIAEANKTGDNPPEPTNQGVH